MKASGILFLACITVISLSVTGMAQNKSARKIKTSWKHYSIITHQGRDVLCEPYVVQKNDWLYKIFKQKGEISEKDFPFFIAIFKQINPHIHNIDAIATGTRILIPLKITDKREYAVDKEGRISVPVVEFHDTAQPSMPRVSVKPHTIAPGDTVSALLDPSFLTEGGGITKQGQALFYQLNPHIKNIDRIFPGDRITIPVPSMRHVQISPVSGDFPPATPSSQATLSSHQLRQLQKYANTVNGRLAHEGKLYFPGRNGQEEVQLDLSETPLIEIDSPRRSILILSNQAPHHPLQDETIRRAISSYWGHVTFQSIETVLPPPDRKTAEPAAPPPRLTRKQIFQILARAGFDYVADDVIRFHVNHIPVSVRLDRVKIPDRPDLLLNSGTVFGRGISALQQKNFQILTFTADQDREEQIQGLLSALGYHVWSRPSFTHQGAVETLPGIYAEQSSNRLLVSLTPATPMIRSFLEARRIKHVLLQP
jgi:hypothetical protein